MSTEAQEIKFWTLTFDNPNVTKSFDKIIKDFEAANPGVTVKLENRATDEHKSALRVASGSDQAPDIYFMWAGLGLGGEFIKLLALPLVQHHTKIPNWTMKSIGPAFVLLKAIWFGIRGEALY